MSTFEDFGLTVVDVQALMSTALHPFVLLAFCHGIYTCIFFIALYYIIESTQSNCKRITLASVISFLWVANTVILSLLWEYTGLLFIGNGTSLEMEFNFWVTGGVPLLLAQEVFRALSVLVADLILIWRCWVLYDKNLKVLALPSLCVITETVSACIVTVFTVTNIDSVVGATQVVWTLVYYSMTVATNSLCTLLILFRIVRVSGIGTSLKTYRGIIEILVESAAIYAIVYMALLVAVAYEFYTGVIVATADSYPMMMSYSITGIAPTLIIARVMAGQSRPDDSWTRPSLPHMRSDVLSATESLQFASAPNQSTQTASTNTGNVDLEAQAEHADGDGDGNRGAPDAGKV